MTQSRPHFSGTRFALSATLMFAFAFAFAVAANADEVDDAHDAYAKANDDYYSSIRNKNLSPQAMEQIQQRIVAPAAEQYHRAFERGMDASLAKYGVVSKTEDSPDVTAKIADADKPWERPADFFTPYGKATDSVLGARSSLLAPADVQVREEDRSPIRYDNSAVRVVRFPGATPAKGNAVRSPASDSSPSSK